MTDVHDKATRSKNMRAIGTRDTAIEKRLAVLLTQAGFDFRVQDPTWRVVPISSSTPGSASSLLTAASGTITTATCLKSPRRAPISGWIRLVKTSSVTNGISQCLLRRAGGC